MSLLTELSANVVDGSFGTFENVAVESSLALNGDLALEGDAVSSTPPQGIVDKWLVVTNGTTEYKLPLAQADAVVVPIVQQPYVPADYNEVQGFRPSPMMFNYADKGYFYTSTLATTPTSSLFNVGTTNVAGVDATTIVPWDTIYPPFYYPRPDQVVLNSGNQVPGPYPYGPVVAANQYPPSVGAVPPPLGPTDNSGQWGWPQWGGDTTLDFGPHFYSAIIGHFGHSHIINLQTKVQAVRANTTADTTAMDLMSEHLIVASTEIFARFALLINYTNGSAIAHTGSNIESDIAQAYTVYIYGTPVPGVTTGTGILNVDFLLNTLNFWATDAAYGNGDAQLVAWQAELETTWNYLLRRNIVGVTPIDLLCWHRLMVVHQADMYDQYPAFRAYFADPTNAAVKNVLNHMIHHSLDGGRQFAAFFIGFYLIVAFIDRLVTVLGNATPSAIPNVLTRIPFIKWNQTRYWQEHVCMFNDYDKASALNDNQTIFKTQVNMLESCASLAIGIGEIFRAFDNMNRDRDAYTTLAGAAGGHAPGFPLGV